MHFVAGRGIAGDLGDEKLQVTTQGVVCSPESFGQPEDTMGRGSR